MKRFVLLLGIALIVPACGDGGSDSLMNQVVGAEKAVKTIVIKGRKVTGGSGCMDGICAVYWWYEDYLNCDDNNAYNVCDAAGVCNSSNCLYFGSPDPWCTDSTLNAMCYDADTAYCECVCNSW